MNIDWHRKASADSVAETTSVLLRSRRGGGLESTFEATGASESVRLERLAEALAAAQPAVPQGDQAGIKERVLAGAASGLAKLNQGEPLKDFTFGEHIGLESVILTNGERPSLFVRNGFVDLKATPREFFAAGIKAANEWSRRTYGKEFDRLAPADREAALKSMEAGKAEFADISGRQFFEAVLQSAMEGFFADPIYGGNRDKVSWRMIGYPGLPAAYADKALEYRGRKVVIEPKSIADFS
jgi:Gluconate 2-dehydrogenase subunit 3